MSHSDAVAEFFATAEGRELPPGYEYPAEPDLGREDALYEVGYGRTDAEDFWNCAWGKEWLEFRTKDPERAERAFKTYAAMKGTDTFRIAWDEESMQKPFLESLEAAELGDPSLIRTDMDVACDYVEKTA